MQLHYVTVYSINRCVKFQFFLYRDISRFKKIELFKLYREYSLKLPFHSLSHFLNKYYKHRRKFIACVRPSFGAR